jgi:hypothetical protein
MISQQLVRDASELLSTAIGMIFEDVNPVVVDALRDEGYAARAQELEAMGAEVAILAAAIGVLARHG